MPQANCKVCNKEFYIKPSHQRYGFGKYCSRKCQHRGQRKGKFVLCEICHKETWKTPKDFRKSKSGKFFCSKSCQTKWRNNIFVGEKHANWRGGEFTYQRIMKQYKIPPVCNGCKINDKRVLIIHHKDSDRKNNNIKNLIWLCRNCHYLIHNGKTL